MAVDTSESNKRIFERSSSRIPCEVTVGGAVHRGFVLNLSASGVFVQIDSNAAIGAEATISIRPSKNETITLNAIVMRSCRAHRSVTAVRTRGVGFALKNAPEAYFTLIAALQL